MSLRDGILDLIGPVFLKHRARDYYQNGVALYKSGDKKAAIEELQRAVKFDCKFARGWAQLASTLAKEARYQEASQAFARAMELNQNEAEVFNLLGETLMNSPGMHKDAVELYRKSLLAEKTLEGWKGLGHSLLKSGQLEESAQAFSQWCVLEPENAKPWFYRGQALMLLKKLDQAALAFEQAINLDEKYGTAYDHLAEVYSKIGRNDDALSLCQKWSSFSPESGQLWYGNAQYLMIAGRPLSSVASYKKALTVQKYTWKAWFDLAHIYYMLERYEDAIDSMQECVKQAKKRDKTWVVIGRSQTRLGRYAEARHSFQIELKLASEGCDLDAVIHDRHVFKALAQVGVGHTNAGESDEATKVWEQLSAQDDRNPYLWAGRTFTHCSLGKRESALAELDGYVSGGSEREADAWRILSEHHTEVWNHDCALESFNKYLERMPSTPELEIKRARLLLEAKRSDDSADALRALLKSSEDNAQAHYDLARIFARSNKKDASLRSLKRALELRASLCEWAQVHRDFDGIRDDERFISMIESASSELEGLLPPMS